MSDPHAHFCFPLDRLQGVRDVIINSDETWVLLILEGEAKCGKDCREMRKEMATLQTKGKGLLKFAYTNAPDNIVVQDGSLQSVGAYFNITGELRLSRCRCCNFNFYPHSPTGPVRLSPSTERLTGTLTSS